jgi:transcriptional regulator with XRE-family HTH domain
MTVGERIQFYRKLNKMSQEELAKRLLISRQTVSLWENDQTMPTIDNLIRLREVFGVSIDEMLVGISGVASEPVAEAAAPAESEIVKSKNEDPHRYVKHIVISSLAAILLIAVVITLVCVFRTDPYGDAGRALGCNLPRAMAVNVTSENTDTENGKLIYTAEIYFSAGDIEALCAAVSSCPGWLSVWDPAAFAPILPSGVGVGADGILVCGKGVEYNTLSDVGTHYLVLELFAAEGMLRVSSVRA